MNKTDALVVVIKKSALAGPYGILLHCGKPRCRNGSPDTTIADRLVDFECGGTAFCGMITPPRDAKYLARIVAGAYKGGRRSKFTYRQVVLSVADTPEVRHGEILAKLKLAVDDYRTKYLSGCPAWVAYYHADKSHLHCHIIATNWDDVEMRLLDWKRADVIGMNRLNWYQHDDFVPGAGLYARKPQERRPRVYAKANTDLRALVGHIKGSDDWKTVGVPYRLQVLQAQGLIAPYETASGNLGYVYNGRKITLAKINYELRTTDAVYVGADGLQYNAAPERRDDVEQQTFFDAQVGAKSITDYLKHGDFPHFKLTDFERADMIRSRVPANPLYRRAARSVLMRRAMYNDACTDIDLALKPIVKAFDYLCGSQVKRAPSVPQAGTYLQFVAGVLNYAMQFSNLALALGKTAQPALDAINVLRDLEVKQGIGNLDDHPI